MPIAKRVGFGVVAALGAAATIFLYASSGRGASQRPIMVSMVQLIATPEKYDGKLVVVVGYLSYGGPDGDSLFLSADDYENGVGENSLWVARTKQMWKERERLYDMYVGVTGVFHASREPETTAPHLAGLIADIQGCHFVSDPRHPMVERLKGLPGVQVGPPKR
jgi:hypothetical protein